MTASSPLALVRRRCCTMHGRSVETYWSPLTPEHGFPSLSFRPGHRALPLCPLPPKRDAHFLSHLSFQERNTGSFQKRNLPACHWFPTPALSGSGLRVSELIYSVSAGRSQHPFYSIVGFTLAPHILFVKKERAEKEHGFFALCFPGRFSRIRTVWKRLPQLNATGPGLFSGAACADTAHPGSRPQGR